MWLTQWHFLISVLKIREAVKNILHYCHNGPLVADRLWITPPKPGLVEEEVQGVGDFVGEGNSFRRVGQRLLQNLLRHLLGVIPLRMVFIVT